MAYLVNYLLFDRYLDSEDKWDTYFTINAKKEILKFSGLTFGEIEILCKGNPKRTLLKAVFDSMVHKGTSFSGDYLGINRSIRRQNIQPEDYEIVSAIFPYLILDTDMLYKKMLLSSSLRFFPNEKNIITVMVSCWKSGQKTWEKESWLTVEQISEYSEEEIKDNKAGRKFSANKIFDVLSDNKRNLFLSKTNGEETKYTLNLTELIKYILP